MSDEVKRQIVNPMNYKLDSPEMAEFLSDIYSEEDLLRLSSACSEGLAMRKRKETIQLIESKLKGVISIVEVPNKFIREKNEGMDLLKPVYIKRALTYEYVSWPGSSYSTPDRFVASVKRITERSKHKEFIYTPGDHFIYVVRLETKKEFEKRDNHRKKKESKEKQLLEELKAKYEPQ
jgi:peptide subunit release factor RF-3